MDVSEMIGFLKSKPSMKLMTALYGKDGGIENRRRYEKVVLEFKKKFSQEEVLLFTSPGRTEISGNHTDHNYGKVLAGSINLDCVGAAFTNNSRTVRIVSETFEQSFEIDLNDLSKGETMSGTNDLVKGLLQGFLEAGYEIGGFDAYITSNVISAAGVSSSASFEMLLCSMVNTFFNQGKLDVIDYAHIGQYAENEYWGKASGLLDQMACAMGGLIAIDFKNPKAPVVEKIDMDFSKKDYSLIIVNTGKGHADLSREYSLVPLEMKKVAEFFGKEVCGEITEQQVIDQLEKVREYAGDRSVLRALHFFEENKRVEEEVAALKEDRFDDFLTSISDSGNSSWKWLQNCFTNANNQEQGITIALALTELFIKEKKKGACRVHGGGFAGVIMTMLPNVLAEEYVNYMEKAIGTGNTYQMSIRPYGAICFHEMALRI